MKKYASIALVLALMATMMVGCGCTNNRREPVPSTTVLPTTRPVPEATTTPTTAATTHPTTLPTEATNGTHVPNGTEGILESGTTEGTMNTTEPAGRARSQMPHNG